MNVSTLRRNITMIERTLREDADVLTPEKVASLTAALNGLKMAAGLADAGRLEFTIVGDKKARAA